MSPREQFIKAPLGMLALAEEFQNISLVCDWAGITRSHFYEIRRAFEKSGSEGLRPRHADTRGCRTKRLPNSSRRSSS